MQKQITTPRFHSQDALRAWAMLLGIVLHAAWVRFRVSVLAPMNDVDGGPLLRRLLKWSSMKRRLGPMSALWKATFPKPLTIGNG